MSGNIPNSPGPSNRNVLRGRSYLLVTLGCFKNEVESDMLRSHLGGLEMIETTRIEEADAILVMTCGFIKEACDEGIDTILELSETAAGCTQKPALIVAGCMGQRYGADLLAEMNELDAVLGCDWKDDIGPAIEAALRGARYRCETRPGGSPDVQRIVSGSGGATVFLKVAEGCDRACGFCTIPSIKGQFRSRPPEEIIQEARRLVRGGGTEVVLLAQDLTSYGSDTGGDTDLVRLLRNLSREEGVHWLRLLYLQPEGVTERLIEEIASNDVICRYLDVPFQHASAPVLRLMARPGSGERHLDLVRRIRDAMPDAAIRSTVMVGYPGETEKDFAELLDFIEEARFDWLGAFTFSCEEGTAAACLDGQVPVDEALSRYNTVVETQDRIEAGSLENMSGRELEVVVDEFCDIEPYDLVGRSYREAPVVDGMIYLRHSREHTGQARPGDFVRARITGHEGLDLVGEI